MFIKLSTTLSIISAAILSAAPASARIIGITAPTTPLTPGETFSVTFKTASFIQNNLQYYVVFGLAPSSYPQGALGQLLGTGYDLVANGHSSTGPGSFDVSVTIPSTFTPSDVSYTLTAAILGSVSHIIHLFSVSSFSLCSAGWSIRGNLCELLACERHCD